MNIENKKSDIDFTNAHAEIMNILSDIMRMGATDNSEKEAIESILEKLRSKKIEPNEALAEAIKILESKQDYH